MKTTLKALTFLALILTVGKLSGADHTWTGAVNDKWSVAGNWIGGTPANDPEATVIFPSGATTLATTNDLTNLHVRSFAVSGNGYTFDGNTLTLGGNLYSSASSTPNVLNLDLVLSAMCRFEVSSDLIVNGALRGIGGVIKSGNGTLRLAGSSANNYTGGTIVEAGTIVLAKTSATNAVGGDLTVKPAAVVRLEASEQIPNAARLNIAGTLDIGQFTETIGPLDLSGIVTARPPGTIPDGLIRLAGDVRINGANSTPRLAGKLELVSASRTVTVDSYDGFDLDVVTFSAPPGTEVVKRGAGRLQLRVTSGPFSLRSIDGYVWISSGSSPLLPSNPNPRIVLEGGTLAGTGPVGSMDATGGKISEFRSTVAGNMRLAGGVTFEAYVSPPKVIGELSLGNASLTINSNVSSQLGIGGKLTIIDNDGADSVLGTFVNLPEAAVFDVGSKNYRITYKGGTGNDVVLEDVSKAYAALFATVRPDPATYQEAITVSVDLYAGYGTPADYPAPTGTLVLKEGTKTIASATIINSKASMTFTPATPGHFDYVLAYSGDTRYRAAESSVAVNVRAPQPILTSLSPESVKAGSADFILMLAGSNFMPNSRVYASYYGYLEVAESSPTQLTAKVPRTMVAQATEFAVAAVNVGDGSQGVIRSNEIIFKVTADEPTPPPPSTIFFEPYAVVAKVTPGANAAWLAVAHEGAGRYLRNRITTDEDRDGYTRFDVTQQPFPSQTVPWRSIWSVVDLSSGEYHIETPKDYPRREEPFKATFHRGPSGDYTVVRFSTGWGVNYVMLARPGVGSWIATIGDGGTYDLDGASNGIAYASTNAFFPVTPTATPPGAFQASDAFIVFDASAMSFSAGRIGEHLDTGGSTPGRFEFLLENYTAPEWEQSLTVSVVRKDGSVGAADVNYAVVSGTATEGSDYVPTSGTLRFAAGEVIKSFVIPLLNDDFYEGTEDAILRLTAPTGGAVAGADVRLRFHEDELPPKISTADLRVIEGNSGLTEGIITVTKIGKTALPVTVQLETSGYEAIPGIDYQPLQTKFVFAPSETTKSFKISVIGDLEIEADETFAITTIAEGAGIERTGAVTIINDDWPSLVVDDAIIVEGSPGQSFLTFEARLSGDRPYVASVDFTTVNGTAIAGEDYVMTSGTITFGYEKTKKFTVPVIADAAAEGNEVLFVNLTNPRGAVLVREKVVGTIVDDDTGSPILSVDDVVLSEGSSSTTTLDFTLHLSQPPGKPVEVAFAAESQTAIAGADFLPAAGSIRFETGIRTKTVSVTVVSDSEPEPNERFVLVLRDATNAALARTYATATILDDDGLDLAFTFTPTTHAAMANEHVLITGTLENRSAASASGVKLTVAIPPEVTVAGAVLGGVPCLVTTQVNCDRSLLAPDSSALFTMTVSTRAEGVATLVAHADSAETERNETNNSSTATLTARPNISIETFLGMEFATMSGQSLRVDLHRPVVDGPLPVIVWLHDGDWSTGERSGGDALRQLYRGYAVASIDYRLSGSARFPAQIQDVKAAIRWIRANAQRFGFDPSRIGVWGRGAGGHLAALAGTSGGVELFDDPYGGNISQSSRVRAVIDWSGPTDFSTMETQDLFCGSIDHNAADSPASRLLGCAVPTCPDKVAAANPITYASADDPPFLILHGAQDCVVPSGQSAQLHAALREKGIDSTLFIHDRAGHEGNEWNEASIVEMVDRFLDEKLKNPVSNPRRRAVRR